jgi:large subunit ribosomal protein L6
MSRVAKMSLKLPQGVQMEIGNQEISAKGALGALSIAQNALVTVALNDGALSFVPVNDSREADAMSGTMHQLVANLIQGVSKGFEKKLSLVGVGYKAQAQNGALNLTVGYSHPVLMQTPTPTEILIKGSDRQRVGQIAAEIRAVRPPEPYKGKGIRYADEKIVIKETKKK